MSTQFRIVKRKIKINRTLHRKRRRSIVGEPDFIFAGVDPPTCARVQGSRVSTDNEDDRVLFSDVPDAIFIFTFVAEVFLSFSR
jgi:hypothetical protein